MYLLASETAKVNILTKDRCLHKHANNLENSNLLQDIL